MQLVGWFLEETSDLIPPIEVDPNSVTPGVVGFVVTLVVGLGVLFLILDMVRRIRRVRYRAMVNEQLDAEANQAD
jgi:capsular polysaccharide biosynthesis protein